jgi:hypothetical protein
MEKQQDIDRINELKQMSYDSLSKQKELVAEMMIARSKQQEAEVELPSKKQPKYSMTGLPLKQLEKLKK